MNFTPTDKVFCGDCQINDNVYLQNVKHHFVNLMIIYVKVDFQFCEHNCSDTEYSNVLITKHEIKEHNLCLEE